MRYVRVTQWQLRRGATLLPRSSQSSILLYLYLQIISSPLIFYSSDLFILFCYQFFNSLSRAWLLSRFLHCVVNPESYVVNPERFELNLLRPFEVTTEAVMIMVPNSSSTPFRSIFMLLDEIAISVLCLWYLFALKTQYICVVRRRRLARHSSSSDNVSRQL
jgi:hypothetical protein